MQRTYDVSVARAGLVAVMVLLALPGTSIAGSTAGSTRTTSDQAHAPLLQLGAGYGSPDEARRVRGLQRKLQALGWDPGRVDGLFGPRTESAVLGFQAAAGLRADGIAGPHTQQALRQASRLPLRRGAGYAQPAGSPRVRRLQRQLRQAGLRPGPVDGLLGPRTEAAVIRLQRRRGLRDTGVADARTRRVLSDAVDQGLRRPAANPSNDRPAPTRIQMTRTAPDEPADVWLVLTALLALALGAVAGSLLGRPRTAVSMAPAVALARGVVAEGVARAASIGRFRGRVHALALGRGGLGSRQTARYLIHDPDKPVPFWVDHEEVARLLDPGPGGDKPASNGRQQAEPRGEPEALDAAPGERPVLARVTDGVRVLGYVSVETSGEPNARAMRDQAMAIDSLCDERGWRLVEVVRDVEAVGGALRRPGLAYAVNRIAKREASCLVVAEVNRLTRSAAELGRLLELLARSGGRLVVMDVGLDTATEPGRIAAESLLKVGSWERRRTLEKTRKGLAAARAKRAASGQSAVEDLPALKERIVHMRSEGMTLQAIADRLNEDGVPTMRGGQLWRPSSVQAALGYRRPRRVDPVIGGPNPAEGRSRPVR